MAIGYIILKYLLKLYSWTNNPLWVYFQSIQ